MGSPQGRPAELGSVVMAIGGIRSPLQQQREEGGGLLVGHGLDQGAAELVGLIRSTFEGLQQDGHERLVAQIHSLAEKV